MTKRPSLPPTVVALGIVSLLHDLAGDMVTPLVPIVVATMGSGPAALGLIEGIADATAALLKLISGHLADRIGRLTMRDSAQIRVLTEFDIVHALSRTVLTTFESRWGRLFR